MKTSGCRILGDVAKSAEIRLVWTRVADAESGGTAAEVEREALEERDWL